MLSFDENEKGWKSVYLGILSPYKNKYQKYIEIALKRAKEDKSIERKLTRLGSTH